jgi:hypothetical protein
VVGEIFNEGTIIDSYWLYNSGVGPSYGIGTGSDEGCTKFGSDESSWPDDQDYNWGLGEGNTPGNYWKTLGSWNSGGTPTGAASTFPKLAWED